MGIPSMKVRGQSLAGMFCACLFLLAGSPAVAQLELRELERLALQNDPAVNAFTAEQQSLQELSVAAAQLPDPVFRMGVVSLPVDTFNLDQEPMSQILTGIIQKFPRGQSRSLKQRQLEERSHAMSYAGKDQQLQIVLDVRLNYLDAVLQSIQSQLTSEAMVTLADLEDITRDYYASGRAQQQDVLQVSVELGRVQDRQQQFRQLERSARSRLTAYLGEQANLPFNPQWPELPASADRQSVRDSLADHPRIQSLQQNLVAADTGVELAEQQYKPEFALDLSYGLRSGQDTSGASRPDLFSFMVVMDLPLFRGKRQDRLTAASLATSSATAYTRDDMYRRMMSEAEGQFAGREDLQKRLLMFEDTLLPQAQFSAESSFESYQSAAGDLTSVLRARLVEYELALERARLQAESLKTTARILYFQGELS